VGKIKKQSRPFHFFRRVGTNLSEPLAVAGGSALIGEAFSSKTKLREKE
jgi:hypothetical protein